MSVISRLLAALYKLPKADTYGIVMEKALEIPGKDGMIMRCDRYYPRNNQKLPTLLVRTPYGRKNLGMVYGNLFAERGFQVIVQSCRGTDDSEGTHTPFRGEYEDGMATVEWIKKQAWFDGRLCMAGPSYMGYTQWAVAKDAGEVLKAISTSVTSSEFYTPIHPMHTFSFEVFLQWIQITESLKGSFAAYVKSMMLNKKRFEEAAGHLPIEDADKIVSGRKTGYWNDWLSHTEASDPWYASEDFREDVKVVKAPNHMVSGWFDIFLTQLLRDYSAMVEAGNQPYLTIGPWAHSSNELGATGLRESLSWLQAHVLKQKDKLRKLPVRIYIMGANQWKDFKQWPPEPTKPTSWYLQEKAALSMEGSRDSKPSQYTYDPHNPTPNFGGANNTTLARKSGSVDNRKLELREDVLVFTSTVLKKDLLIIGTATVDLYVESSLVHTDFFVRLCDVDEKSISMNICDGIIRLPSVHSETMKDGSIRIRIDLSATAYMFRVNHRIRLQVSSGAHPRYVRNLGTGEPIGTGVTMKVAQQSLYHDPEHPSSLVLPVVIQ